MNYQKSYYYLFGQILQLMDKYPELREELIYIQQRAEDIIIEDESVL